MYTCFTGTLGNGTSTNDSLISRFLSFHPHCHPGKRVGISLLCNTRKEIQCDGNASHHLTCVSCIFPPKNISSETKLSEKKISLFFSWVSFQKRMQLNSTGMTVERNDKSLVFDICPHGNFSFFFFKNNFMFVTTNVQTRIRHDIKKKKIRM